MNSHCKIALFTAIVLKYAMAFPQNLVVLPKDTLIKQYDSLQAILNGSFLRRDTTDADNGHYYAWGISFMLDSYVTMYKATSDTRYLVYFVKIGNRVLSMRDDELHTREWDGRSGPGWSTTKFWSIKSGKSSNHNPPALDLVLDATIVYPFLLFASAVLNDSVALKEFLETARDYLTSSMQTIDFHINRDWNQIEQRFTIPKGSPDWADGINVPNNYEAITGVDLLVLYELTGKKEYLVIAKLLAQNLKKAFVRKGNSVIWHYWSGKGFNGWDSASNVSKNTPAFRGQKSVEDLDHGGSEVQFILACFQHDILFTRNDIHLIINCFNQNINRGDYLAQNMDGSGGEFTYPIYPGTFSYWFQLCTYSARIFFTFYRIYYFEKEVRTNPNYLYFLSELISHYGIGKD